MQMPHVHFPPLLTPMFILPVGTASNRIDDASFCVRVASRRVLASAGAHTPMAMTPLASSMPRVKNTCRPGQAGHTAGLFALPSPDSDHAFRFSLRVPCFRPFLHTSNIERPILFRFFFSICERLRLLPGMGTRVPKSRCPPLQAGYLSTPLCRSHGKYPISVGSA